MSLFGTLLHVDVTDFTATVNTLYISLLVVSRYWYKNGVLRPDLVTVFIAMDKCAKVNGGLQVRRFRY